MISPRFSLLAFALISAVSASPAPAPGPSPLATRATRSNQVIHPSFSATKCLTAASNANNAAVEIEDCVPGAKNQLWTLTGSTVTIFGDKCLDDTNGSRANGQKLQIYTCFAGNTNQKWTNNGQAFQLTGSTKCMDLTNGNRDNGNIVQLWECTGGGNQKWIVADGSTVTPPSSSTPPGPLPTTTFIRSIKSEDSCLTASSKANNAAVTIEPCNGSSAQQWTHFQNTFTVFGKYCLDVTGGSTTNGNKMQIYTCNTGNTNQQFVLTIPPQFPRSRQIVWSGKNKCVDLTDSNLTDGTQMQIWSCGSDNHNQIWDFVAVPVTVA